MKKLFIIGAGPGGISSALYAKRANIDVSVIYGDNSSLINAHQIDNYYGVPSISGKELYDIGIIPSTERNYTAPRLSELEDRDIVRVIGKKKCKYTGKMVAVYQKTEDIERIRREYENMSHIPRLD